MSSISPLPTLEEAAAQLRKTGRTLHRQLEKAGIANRVKYGRLTQEAAEALGLVSPTQMTPLPETHDTDLRRLFSPDDIDPPSADMDMTPIPARRRRTGEILRKAVRVLKPAAGFAGLLLDMAVYACLWPLLPTPALDWLMERAK